MTRRSKDNLRRGSSEPFSYADSPGSVNVPTAGQGHNELFLIQLAACSHQGVKIMKPPKTGLVPIHEDAKHPSPLGSQQAVAEKAANSSASVKARVDSKNMPDTPARNLQHTPNSSGRK